MPRKSERYRYKNKAKSLSAFSDYICFICLVVEFGTEIQDAVVAMFKMFLG